MSFEILFSQATAIPSVAGSSSQAAFVILDILGYSEGPAGPEVTALCNTPHRVLRTLTLPASVVEVYTVLG